MANKYFRQFVNTAEPAVVSLFARVTFGAAGVPTLVTGSSKGIKSIARVSAGKYTITLGNTQTTDTYNALLNVSHLFDEITSAAAPAAPEMYLSGNAVSTAGTLQVVFNAAGTATDPASTEAVDLQIWLKNSSAF